MTSWMLALALVACGDKDDADGTTGDGGAEDGGAEDGGTGDGGDGGAGDGGTSGDGGGDGGADGGTGDGGTGDGGAGPEVWDLVNPDLCDAVEGFEGVPGAASYFVGEYWPPGAPTAGVETWALYANPAWEAEGGADCRVVWNMTSTPTGTGACGSCDYGIAVSASLDTAATTCPEGLYAGDETWSAAYDVDEGSDGCSRFYFAGSGELIGTGYLLGAEVSFITEDSCAWFGR
ncbi:hypothetical protein L6R53_14245 [Myxococcota bacterium]|nr:hypothetical protein [Myxococcota bacterium]